MHLNRLAFLRTITLASTLIWLVIFASIVYALTALYEEGVDGDMSNDGDNPSQKGLDIGRNSIEGNTGPGDRDFLTIVVPTGYRISSLTLEIYSGSGSQQSFLGIVNGTELGVIPALADEGDMLGYYLMNNDAVGADILPSMGQAFGAQGFTPPLPAGAYTLWFQELSGPTVNYKIEINVVEDPDNPFIPSDILYLPVVAR